MKRGSAGSTGMPINGQWLSFPVFEAGRIVTEEAAVQMIVIVL